jgi:hypothetical protein
MIVLYLNVVALYVKVASSLYQSGHLIHELLDFTPIS